jgi:hypothetical protein
VVAVQCFCTVIGGVERWGRLRVWRRKWASVSDWVQGESHMVGGVERWVEVESIER